MPQNEHGHNMCWRRVKLCHNPECPAITSTGKGHRYGARDSENDEYDLWECPECGHDRHCRQAYSEQGHPLEEGEACKHHGGASLKGAASPQYVTGKYSDYIPSNLLPDFLEFLYDPDRLSLEKEMALTRAIYLDLVRDIDAFDSKAAWKRLFSLFKQHELLTAKKEMRKAGVLWLKMEKILENGVNNAESRKEVRDFINTERQLVDTQRKIHRDMGEFMTRGAVLTILSNMNDAIKEHVLPLEGGPRATTILGTVLKGFFGNVGERRPDSGGNGAEVIDHDSGVAD